MKHLCSTARFLHIFANCLLQSVRRNGSELVNEPIVLEHESSGVIVKVGSRVDPGRIGEQVAIKPWTVCCKSGRNQLCQRCSDLIPPRRGTLCRYFKVPSDIAYKLSDNLSLEDGATTEPRAVAIHAIRSLGKLRAGPCAIVFGCSPVDLLCMAVAKALDSFTPPHFLANESIREYSTRSSSLFKKRLDGDGIDLIVDTSRAETNLQMGLIIAKNVGTFVQIGVGRTDVQFPISVVMNTELTIKGSLRYGMSDPGDYPLAISLASSGKINLKPLVTHKFEFADAIKAFETTKSEKDANGNVVLKTMISGPSDQMINGSVNGHLENRQRCLRRDAGVMVDGGHSVR
ncbi:hypothetical protein ACEPAI_4577 [Sanghuangporus weigelae]